MPTEGPALPTGGLIYLQRGLLGIPPESLLCTQRAPFTYRGASFSLRRTLCTESTEGPPLLIEGPPIHCLQRCLQYPQRDYDTYRGLLCQEGPPKP